MSGHYGRGGGGGRGHYPPPQGGPGGNPYYPQQGPGGGRGTPIYRQQPQYPPEPPMRGEFALRPGAYPRHEDIGGGGGFGRGYNIQDPRYDGPLPPSPSPSPRISHRLDEAMSGSESASASEGPYPRTSTTGGRVSTGDKFANDCEIVILNKEQQPYGELIEKKLKDLGLTVDIIFRKQDIQVTEFLKPIAKLGTIFAIVIDAENEQQRNLNFYQFRGFPKPQYHKNVPLQTAFDVLMQRYNELKLKEVGRVPENIKTLFIRVANDNVIEDEEYSSLHRFLSEHKRRQNAFLKRTSNVIQDLNDIKNILDSPEGNQLQQRIMAILNEENGHLKLEI